MDSIKKSNIALNLLSYRDSKGLSQEELAKLIGVDKKIVEKWESYVIEQCIDKRTNSTTIKENDCIRQILDLDEFVLWRDKPNIHKCFMKQDAFVVPISIIFLTFSIFITVFLYDIAWFFGFIGLLFLVSGFYMCLGRFIFKYIVKKQTLYLITNKNIIIYINKKHIKKTISLNDIKNVSVNINKNGIGNITFKQDYLPLQFNSRIYSNTGMDIPLKMLVFNTFYDIDDVEIVHEFINDLIGYKVN